MAGGHRVLESGQHQLGEVDEAEDVGIEGLVGVQVDADPVIGGDLEEDLGGAAGVTAVLEVGTPADEIGAGGERVARAARAGRRRRARRRASRTGRRSRGR